MCASCGVAVPRRTVLPQDSHPRVKHMRPVRRLRGMEIRSIATAAARSLVLVGIALLLVFVLLPAAIAAQAATI